MTCSFRPTAQSPRPIFRPSGVALPTTDESLTEVQGPDPEVIRETAYAEGLSAGRAELPVVEAARLESAAQALELAASRLGDECTALRRVERESLIDLALAMAAHVIGCEIEHGPAVLEQVTERAIAALTEPVKPVLQLSPTDHATLQAGAAPGLEAQLREAGIDWIADGALSPGEIVLRDASRTIDLRLQVVLAELRRELESAALGSGPEPASAARSAGPELESATHGAGPEPEPETSS